MKWISILLLGVIFPAVAQHAPFKLGQFEVQQPPASTWVVLHQSPTALYLGKLTPQSGSANGVTTVAWGP